MRFSSALLSKLSKAVPRPSMHIGEVVVGRKASYRLMQVLQEVNNVPTVFKAEVLQDDFHLIPAQW